MLTFINWDYLDIYQVVAAKAAVNHTHKVDNKAIENISENIESKDKSINESYGVLNIKRCKKNDF